MLGNIFEEVYAYQMLDKKPKRVLFIKLVLPHFKLELSLPTLNCMWIKIRKNILKIKKKSKLPKYNTK